MNRLSLTQGRHRQPSRPRQRRFFVARTILRVCARILRIFDGYFDAFFDGHRKPNITAFWSAMQYNRTCII